jgi:hypothetical protein
LRVKLKRIKTLQKYKNQNNEDKKKTIHYKLRLKNETKTYETFIRGSKKINHKNKHQILNIKTE